MRKLIVFSAIGFMMAAGALSTSSFSNAAESSDAPQVVPSPTRTPESIRFSCFFEGRDRDGRDRRQDEDLRCRVRGSLPFGKSDILSERDRDARLEIDCTNGFDLETRKASVNFERDTIWINADSRGEIATLRLRDFNDHLSERRDNDRVRADLLIANGRAHHLEGNCRFEDDHRREP